MLTEENNYEFTHSQPGKEKKKPVEVNVERTINLIYIRKKSNIEQRRV